MIWTDIYKFLAGGFGWNCNSNHHDSDIQLGIVYWLINKTELHLIQFQIPLKDSYLGLPLFLIIWKIYPKIRKAQEENADKVTDEVWETVAKKAPLNYVKNNASNGWNLQRQLVWRSYHYREKGKLYLPPLVQKVSWWNFSIIKTIL